MSVARQAIFQTLRPATPKETLWRSHRNLATRKPTGGADDARGKESHLRFITRNRIRVVRLLSVRRTCRHHRQAILFGPRRHLGVHLRAAGVRFGLPGPSVRCHLLRPTRRHDRPEVHLPGDHPDHGRVDLHRRPAAFVHFHRHGSAGDPDRPAPAAGPGPGRRIRRCSDLRGRTCTARQARCIHIVDPDDGDVRPVPLAARRPWHPQLHGRKGFWRLGLAHSLPGLDHLARRFSVDPLEPE